MAKDDYEVLVFKILTYFYGVFKRKVVFSEESFKAAIRFKDFSEDYLTDVLYMMHEEGYLEGMAFSKARGSTVIPLGDFSDIRIKAKGIDYLKNNGSMNRIKEYFLENPDLISSLVSMLLG